MPKLQLKAMSLVVVGDLNPKIFHPEWFASEELFSSQDADSAEIEIVHPDVTAFRLTWCDVRVTRERLILSTAQDPYFERLREVALGLFSLLRHTPVRAIGINHEAHWQADSEERWDAFGHLVAPQELWAGVLDSPALTNVVVEEQKRRDGRPGHIGCMIEPSPRFKPGVFIRVNDHYEFKKQDKPGGAEELLEVLEKLWLPSADRAHAIMKRIEERL